MNSQPARLQSKKSGWRARVRDIFKPSSNHQPIEFIKLQTTAISTPCTRCDRMNTTIQNQKPCIQQPGVSWNALWRPTNIHISSRRLARAKPRSIRVPAIITTASSGKTARPRGDTGVRHPASDITVKSILGEGSFGQVFEGQLVLGNGTEEHVVLKRVKQRVKVCGFFQGGGAAYTPAHTCYYNRCMCVHTHTGCK